MKAKRKNRATSLHSLNADKVRDFFGRMPWGLLNIINNSFPIYNVDKKLILKDFIVSDFKKYWNQLEIKSSPTRKLSDLFWLNLPWDKIKDELVSLDIVDIGCGSGAYGEKLNRMSDGRIHRYVGIDIVENRNWNNLQQKHRNFQFIVYNGRDILSHIPENTNFIMTQSTIEHIDDDLVFFNQIKDYIEKSHKNTIQVHLVPSSYCLWLYYHHGIRQYTPRTLSKITRLFNGFSYSFLFGLGGAECNKLFMDFVAKPRIRGHFLRRKLDYREVYPAEYEQKSYSAIEKDMRVYQKYPTFYALVIHSYYRNKIW